MVVDTTRTYRIGEVVVTGSNNATGRNLLPYTVSTIGSPQLEATGQSQLLSAISVQVPSLFVSERNIFGFGVSSGGSGGIKIRGVGGSPTNSVLMMVDGQPQFAGIYSHHVADFYGTEYVDHVEVLRGPGSVLYGSNAMGGVINVITKNAEKDGVHTTLTSQYGSYNTWRSSLVNTTRFGKFSSLVSLGYDRTDGLQDNFDFKQGSLYAKLGYDFSDAWKALADYSLMNFIGNDPIYPKLDNPEATDIYHQNITRGEASLSMNNYYGITVVYVYIIATATTTLTTPDTSIAWTTASASLLIRTSARGKMRQLHWVSTSTLIPAEFRCRAALPIRKVPCLLLVVKASRNILHTSRFPKTSSVVC